MSIYDYWALIGFLFFFSIFMIIRWANDKLNSEVAQWFVGILFFVVVFVGMILIPINVDISSTEVEFKVDRVTKKLDKVYIFNDKKESFELTRSYGEPNGGSDTIQPGDIFIIKTERNYYGYKTIEIIPMIKSPNGKYLPYSPLYIDGFKPTRP